MAGPEDSRRLPKTPVPKTPAIVLAAGVWTIAQTVSDAQIAKNESSPSEIAAPMLSEGEMLTQTL